MAKILGFLLGVVVAFAGPAVLGVLSAPGGIELGVRWMALAYGIGALIFWAVVSYFSGASALGAALAFGTMIYAVHWIPNRTTNLLNDVPGVTTGMIEGLKQYTLNGVVPILAVISLVFSIQQMVRAVQRRRRERAEAARVQAEQEAGLARQQAEATAAYPVAGGDYAAPAGSPLAAAGSGQPAPADSPFSRGYGNSSYDDLFDDEPVPSRPRSQAEEETAMYPGAAPAAPTDTRELPVRGSQAAPADQPTQLADADQPTQLTDADQPTHVADADRLSPAATAQPDQPSRAEDPTEVAATERPTQASPGERPTQASPGERPTQAGPGEQATQVAPAEQPTQVSAEQAAPVDGRGEERAVDARGNDDETMLVPSDRDETVQMPVKPAKEPAAEDDATKPNVPPTSSGTVPTGGTAPASGTTGGTTGDTAPAGGTTGGGDTDGPGGVRGPSAQHRSDATGTAPVRREERMGQQYRERMEDPEDTGEFFIQSFEGPGPIGDPLPRAPRLMDLPTAPFRPTGA